MSGVVHVPFHVIVTTRRRGFAPVLDGRIGMIIPFDEDDHVTIFRLLEDDRVKRRSVTIIVLLGHHIPDPPVNLNGPSEFRFPPALPVQPAIVNMDARMTTNTSVRTGMRMVPQPPVPDPVLLDTSSSVLIGDHFA